MKASGISSSSQVDRDEYPYAHTEEGGSNASVMQVPRSENRFHGQNLSTLVKSNNMKTGDHFPIILVPDNSKKEKQHIPIGSTVSVTEKIHPNRDVVKNIAIGATVVAILKSIGTIAEKIVPRTVTPIIVPPTISMSIEMQYQQYNDNLR